MEADWSVELAADDPTIVVPWAAEAGQGGDAECRFLDLRASPQSIDKIEEIRHRPQLRSALLALNGEESQLWTAKCDVWEGREEFDPFEMDAVGEEANFGAGSYIDILPRTPEIRSSFKLQERWVRTLSTRLRGGTIRGARTEFVLRHAEVDGIGCFGITWFLQGCAPNAAGAVQRWGEAMQFALEAVMRSRFV